MSNSILNPFHSHWKSKMCCPFSSGVAESSRLTVYSWNKQPYGKKWWITFTEVFPSFEGGWGREWGEFGFPINIVRVKWNTRCKWKWPQCPCVLVKRKMRPMELMDIIAGTLWAAEKKKTAEIVGILNARGKCPMFLQVFFLTKTFKTQAQFVGKFCQWLKLRGAKTLLAYWFYFGWCYALYWKKHAI